MIRKPSDNRVQYFFGLIIGGTGAYKTLLASTAKDTLFLDPEDGSAHTGCWAITYTSDAGGYNKLKQDILALGRLRPDEDGVLHYSRTSEDGEAFEIPVRTVVLDSLDVAQKLCSFGLSTGNLMQFYGKLLREMENEIIYPLKRINANVIIIAHNREFQPADSDKAKGVLPTVWLALDGSIRDRVDKHFDTIMHLVIGQDGKRTLLTQPEVRDGRFYQAKDRYYVYEGRSFDLKIDKETGKPPAEIMDTILERTSGGITEDNQAVAKKAVADVKTAWIKAAQAEKALEIVDMRKPEHRAKLVKVLGDVYEQLTVENIERLEDLRIVGIERIKDVAAEVRKAAA